MGSGGPEGDNCLEFAKAGGPAIIDDGDSRGVVIDFKQWRDGTAKEAKRQAAKDKRRKARTALAKLERAVAKAHMETGHMTKEDYRYACALNGWAE
tara:strand:- start:516 stop:803 length:288 start_codon:yes stop_codon:yes gene_type:complete